MQELEKILEEIEQASYLNVPNEKSIPIRVVKDIICNRILFELRTGDRLGRKRGMMMDAVEFLKEKERMCNKCSACSGCPVDKKNNGFYMDCEDLAIENPEEFVAIIEKWSAEHPVKTRQSEFLKIFPNAVIRNGVIRICPRNIDQNSITSEECEKLICFECRKKYWFAEVE